MTRQEQATIIGNVIRRAGLEGRSEEYIDGFVSCCDLLGFAVCIDEDTKDVTVFDQLAHGIIYDSDNDSLLMLHHEYLD